MTELTSMMRAEMEVAAAARGAPSADADFDTLHAEGPRRHVAVPLVRAGRQLGVLFLDSDADGLPALEDGAVFKAMMNHIEAAVELATRRADRAGIDDRHSVPAAAPLKVRRFPRNDVVFLDGEYLIKGLAGAIFWKLMSDYYLVGRTEFSNLELRLELSQTHPEKAENLESRLVMLMRRLEAFTDIRVERVARGRLRLIVKRPIELVESA